MTDHKTNNNPDTLTLSQQQPPDDLANHLIVQLDDIAFYLKAYEAELEKKPNPQDELENYKFHLKLYIVLNNLTCYVNFCKNTVVHATDPDKEMELIDRKSSLYDQISNRIIKWDAELIELSRKNKCCQGTSPPTTFWRKQPASQKFVPDSKIEKPQTTPSNLMHPHKDKRRRLLTVRQ